MADRGFRRFTSAPDEHNTRERDGSTGGSTGSSAAVDDVRSNQSNFLEQQAAFSSVESGGLQQPLLLPVVNNGAVVKGEDGIAVQRSFIRSTLYHMGTPSPCERSDFYAVWEKHQKQRKMGCLERLVRKMRRHWNSLRTPNSEEGLDFDLPENKLHAQKMDALEASVGGKNTGNGGAGDETKAGCGALLFGAVCGLQGMRWIIGWLIAIVISCIAAVLGLAVGWLSDTKFERVRDTLDQHDFALAFAHYASTNAGFVTIATMLVAFLDLRAKGSGVPEIKSYLNGRKIHRVISLRTLLSKLMGVILSVSGSMVLGKEGPMMHIGAVVGAILSQGRSELSGVGLQMLIFRSDLEKRFFVSIGCACGVAAAFSAPLGGVLFVIEEASSYWSVELTWLTFFATMTCASLVDFVLSGSRDADDWGLMSQSAVVSFGSFEGASRSACYPEQVPYRFVHLPIFVLMGVVGGIAGALFNSLNLRISQFRAKSVTGPWVRSFEAVAVSAFTSVIFFGIPSIYPCRSRHDARYTDPHHLISANLSCKDVTPLGHFCDDSSTEFNDVESLLLTGLDSAVKQLFHSELLFDYLALVLACVSMFVLACVTYGISIPSGLFVPAICIGSAYGRIVGQLLWELDPHGNSMFGVVDPGTFALMGAAAMLGGITRMTISIVVILIETTNNSTYAVPIMVTIMASKVVGDLFTDGLYDMHIELQGIKFVHDTPPVNARKVQVFDCMNKRPVVFHIFERVGDILEKLSNCSHNGFPVVSYLSIRTVVGHGDNAGDEGATRRRNLKGQSTATGGTPSLVSHRSLDGQTDLDSFLVNNINNSYNDARSAVASAGSNNSVTKTSPDDFRIRKIDSKVVKKRRIQKSMTDGSNLNANKATEDEKEGFGVFEGTILRSELLIILYEKGFLDESTPLLERIKNTEPQISWRKFYKHYPRHPSITDVVSRLEAEDLERVIDLRPYLNSSALSVHHSVYMTRVHQLFRHLGLRHLTVVNTINQVVGIVTREQVAHNSHAPAAAPIPTITPLSDDTTASAVVTADNVGHETAQVSPQLVTVTASEHHSQYSNEAMSPNVSSEPVDDDTFPYDSWDEDVEASALESEELESSMDTPMRMVNSWRRVQSKRSSTRMAHQLLEEVKRCRQTSVDEDDVSDASSRDPGSPPPMNR